MFGPLEIAVCILIVLAVVGLFILWGNRMFSRMEAQEEAYLQERQARKLIALTEEMLRQSRR